MRIIMGKKLTIALLVTCLSILLLSACSTNTASQNPSNPFSSTEPVTPEDNEAASLWDLGIDTLSLDEVQVTQEDFRNNKLTVLNIWATWCPPCIRELPHLQEVSSRFEGTGVQIVGVLKDGVTESGAYDAEVIQSARILLDDAGAHYLVVLPDQTLQSQLLAYTQSYPTTYFIDSNGTIVHMVSGAKEADRWEEIINEVLASIEK